jgi:hypothetical protein
VQGDEEERIGCSGMPFHVGRQPLYIQDEALNLERKITKAKKRKGKQLRSHPEERRGEGLRLAQKQHMTKSKVVITLAFGERVIQSI